MDLIKSIDQSFKDVDVKKGIVTGYFSSFNYKDTDGDILRKGAYLKTIAENGPESKNQRIRHLLDHDKTKSVANPLVLLEDDFGLYYESKPGRHTAGRDFLLMAEDGLIKEHSVRIKPIRQGKSANDNANIISEVFMWEGSSMQAWGANQWTPLMGVKSLSDAKEILEVLEKSFKSGQYSDEAFMELEPLYKNLGNFFKATPAPVETTQEPDGEEKADAVNYYEIFKSAFN